MLFVSEFSWDCDIIVLDLLCMASLCCMIMAAWCTLVWILIY